MSCFSSMTACILIDIYIYQNLGADLYSADPLPFFQMIYPNQSNSLINVYNRIFRQYPIVSHASEADVFTLLLSSMWTPFEFLNYIEEKAMLFDDIVKSWWYVIKWWILLLKTVVFKIFCNTFRDDIISYISIFVSRANSEMYKLNMRE